ncbi:hypothetical protein LBMAG46_26780 [Planctomycetia bacterium]|nr:hypothetical protein LBMAG46_26780 [Planctomycetia bacterium]
MGEEAAEQEAFETIAAVVPAIQAVFRTAAAGLAGEPAGLCSGAAVAGSIEQLHRGDGGDAAGFGSEFLIRSKSLQDSPLSQAAKQAEGDGHDYFTEGRFQTVDVMGWQLAVQGEFLQS